MQAMRALCLSGFLLARPSRVSRGYAPIRSVSGLRDESAHASSCALRFLRRGQPSLRRLSLGSRSAAFDAEVAPAALQCEETLVQLAECLDVHPKQIKHAGRGCWRELLASGNARMERSEPEDLHAQIGQQACPCPVLLGANSCEQEFCRTSCSHRPLVPLTN